MNEVFSFQIDVNQELVSFHTRPSVTDILQHLTIASTQGLAIAVNDSVLPKSQWDSHFFRPQDKVLIINATQGG